MQNFFQFLLSHWMLSGLFLVAFVMLIREEAKHSSAGPASVLPTKAVQLINHEGAVVIDLRDKGDFEAGSLVSARSMPADTIMYQLKKLQKYKSKPLLLVCRDGRAAPKVRTALRQAGFEQVYFLFGGVKRWQENNLPLVPPNGSEG